MSGVTAVGIQVGDTGADVSAESGRGVIVALAMGKRGAVGVAVKVATAVPTTRVTAMGSASTVQAVNKRIKMIKMRFISTAFGD
jgi:hypothetical protein